jgi:hypothetical protein
MDRPAIGKILIPNPTVSALTPLPLKIDSPAVATGCTAPVTGVPPLKTNPTQDSTVDPENKVSNGYVTTIDAPPTATLMTVALWFSNSVATIVAGKVIMSPGARWVFKVLLDPIVIVGAAEVVGGLIVVLVMLKAVPTNCSIWPLASKKKVV